MKLGEKQKETKYNIGIFGSLVHVSIFCKLLKYSNPFEVMSLKFLAHESFCKLIKMIFLENRGEEMI
jgi:hypothetical protein